MSFLRAHNAERLGEGSGIVRRSFCLGVAVADVVGAAVEMTMSSVSIPEDESSSPLPSRSSLLDDDDDDDDKSSVSKIRF